MSSESPEVHGRCEPSFESLRRALADIMATGAEVGAALAVHVGKQAVVDLWAGHKDSGRTRAWDEHTIVNLYSVGKAITAVCALRLVEEGALDLDAPVSRYWPEFAQAGKRHLPVRYLLTHQAGLPAVFRVLPPGAMLRWDVMTEALAAQEPWWEPGAGHGYHVNTYGFLVGEVVRRITGRSLGTYLREEIAGPAGIDFSIGCGPELDARCADVIPPRPGPDGEPTRVVLDGELAALAGLARMRAGAYVNPPGLSGQAVVNTREWRAAEVPSTNGHGNARAVARLYAALAGDGDLDGVHVLAPAMVEMAIGEQVYGEDLVLQRPTRFGLGFQLTMAERPLGPNPRAFGHFGAGGSLGFADPDARVAFAYAMNQGRAGWQHRHVRHLIDLVYEAL
ncbi:MAG TPA: serine hydrolase domain-containing protein [Candidatus Deferrimicrobiaceae bacterium]|nr:serine hydrolase domain-containing protein [Candidatus Deferrimicrobiaceae bacterium]